MRIVQIPLLRDNYGYLIVSQQTNNAVVIDPSEADPVWQRVEQEKVSLTAILNTHHHRDHTGGNEGILAQHKVDVYGHKSDSARIFGLTRGVEEGDEIEVDLESGRVRNLTNPALLGFAPFSDHAIAILDKGGLIPYLKSSVASQEKSAT